MSARPTRYRCPHCRRIVQRPGRKAWIKSWCERTGRSVHLVRVPAPGRGKTGSRSECVLSRATYAELGLDKKTAAVAERRTAVATLTADGKSGRQIAKVLGVDHTTVVDDLKGGGNPPAAARNRSGSSDARPRGGGNPPSQPLDAVSALAATADLRRAADADALLAAIARAVAAVRLLRKECAA